VTGAQTIIVHTSGTNAPTLVLASLGVVLALASLAWQARSFIVTGSRITVELRVAFKGRGSVVSIPHNATTDQVSLLQSQSFTEPVLAVRVNNTGRGSTSVVSVDLAFDDGGALDETVRNPPLPFRLDGESEQSWYIDAQPAFAYAKTVEQIQRTGKPHHVRGRVKLGNRKVVLSKNHVSLPSS